MPTQVLYSPVCWVFGRGSARRATVHLETRGFSFARWREKVFDIAHAFRLPVLYYSFSFGADWSVHMTEQFSLVAAFILGVELHDIKDSTHIHTHYSRISSNFLLQHTPNKPECFIELAN